jgi:two-component system cell cycle response regulator
LNRILLVEEDSDDLEFLSQVFLTNGDKIQNTVDPDAALHRLKAWKPQLVLVNLDLEQVRAVNLVSKIRQLTKEDREEYVSIVFMSSSIDIEGVKAELNAGADSFLMKPFRHHEVLSCLHSMIKLKELQDSLRRSNRRIDDLMSTDELTGLLNVRAVFRRGEEQISRSRKFRKSIAALLINLDGFLSVNQSHGFLTGSRILQEVGMRIRQCIRSIDVAARVGADEFLVLLDDMDLAEAEVMAERVLESIQLSPYKEEKQMIKLTAAIGVGGLSPDQSYGSMTDLFHIVSEALRSAKANGAGRIEVYSFT